MFVRSLVALIPLASIALAQECLDLSQSKLCSGFNVRIAPSDQFPDVQSLDAAVSAAVDEASLAASEKCGSSVNLKKVPYAVDYVCFTMLFGVGVSSELGGIFQNITATAKDIADSIKDTAVSTGETIRDTAVDLFDGIKGIFAGDREGSSSESPELNAVASGAQCFNLDQLKKQDNKFLCKSSCNSYVRGFNDVCKNFKLDSAKTCNSLNDKSCATGTQFAAENSALVLRSSALVIFIFAVIFLTA